MTNNKINEFSVIEAAGGLLWRDTPQGLQIAIIHRTRYDDWTLPKGKLRHGESWQEAAIREVYEETHCDAELGDFAGSISYQVLNVPKIVLYWNMKLIRELPFSSSEEVDQLIWTSIEEALELLSYADEKCLLINHIEPNE
jgi:8-oxo-dGTP diphosphatase